MLDFNKNLIEKIHLDESFDTDKDGLLNYIHELDSRNLPAIISLSHFEEIFGLKASVIAGIVYDQKAITEHFIFPRRMESLGKLMHHFHL